MTPTLDELERLLAEATPGRWSSSDPNGFCDCRETLAPTKHENYKDCQNWVWEDFTILNSPGPWLETDDGSMMTGEDAALAAAAVNALPDLIAAARERDRLRALKPDDSFWVPLSQHEAEVKLHLEAEAVDMARIIGLKDEIGRIAPENERLRDALIDLQAILCDPEGTPCFTGSDGDREVARQAFAALAGEGKP